ncbi:MAG: hypothetical protein IJQ21_04300 [Lachnospiraceae bacterium]|nr:hypothetical protein [Lachnospiraceae bacterium]
MKTAKRKAASLLTVIVLTAGTVMSGNSHLTVQAREMTKDESVSIKTDASGNPYRVTVENTLSTGSRKGSIRDVSHLTDIRNKNGDEEYTADADGNLVWDNNGADILYEGEADADTLPVAVNVSYSLNGKSVTPERIAGASGKVRIRFDYENKTAGEDYVPFLFLSAAMLDADVFANVRAVNGNVSRMGDYLIVTGFVFPGLYDALKLASYEKTAEIDIPDYLEIEADATDFALDFTATMVMNGMFEEAETDGLDDIEDMLDGMDELTGATEELADGMGKLLDGAGEFRDGLVEYTDAADEIHEGATALSEGLAEINANMGKLTQGATALTAGLSELCTGLSMVDLSALSGGSMEDMIAALTLQAAELQKTIDTLSAVSVHLRTQTATAPLTVSGPNATQGTAAADLAAIDLEIARLGAIRDALSGQAALVRAGMENPDTQALADSMRKLQTGVAQLATGAGSLTQGIYLLADGMGKAGDGASVLVDGIKEFSEAGTELKDGYTELYDGIREAADGAITFRDETKDALTDTDNEALRDIFEALRAVKEADDAYTTFSGAAAGYKSTVRFVFETDAVKR